MRNLENSTGWGNDGSILGESKSGLQILENEEAIS